LFAIIIAHSLLSSLTRRRALCALALLGLIPAQSNAAVTAFVPNQFGLTSRPLVGVSQTTDDYVLTGESSAYVLDKSELLESFVLGAY